MMSARILYDESRSVAEVSDTLYGIFFEDINFAADGGLYAELVSNNSFEYFDRDGKIDKHMYSWEKLDGIDCEVRSDRPLNEINCHYLHIARGGRLKNRGFCQVGFAVKSGESYNFSLYARGKKQTVTARIVTESGVLVGETATKITSSEWKKYEGVMTSWLDAEVCALELIFDDSAEVDIDFVSLIPEHTYKCRKNGLRADLVEMLADLRPGFMRFPGGCIVEGRSFANMYRWKDTVGPIERRRVNWNRWQAEEYQPSGRDSSGYYQSFGLGFYEYFLLCEDIGAKPVPVMNVGMTCQFHEGLLVPLGELQPYIDDCIDLVEFANGSPDTKWGALRAEMGHPEPFGLEYIAIGNEQWGDQYFERYELFADAILAVYPDLKLLFSAGPNCEGEYYEQAMKWISGHRDLAFATDEHFYKSPEWFYNNVNKYDSFDRTLPKVFAGEYAAHTSPERRCSWRAALAEAAFLTGIERNADCVAMSCYAPLFSKTGCFQWQPDLIWFDNSSVYGTPSYYVQKLFSNNVGDRTLPLCCDDSELYISATEDSASGQIYLKIVNATEQEKTVDLSALKLRRRYTWIKLGTDLDAENSHEEPKRVYPSSKKHIGAQVTLEPHSLNVIIG